MFDEEWEILDRKELGTIQFFLVPSMKFNIIEAKTTMDLMEHLVKLYENPQPQIRHFS